MLKEIVARIQVKIKGILLKSRNLFKSIRDYILKGAKHLTAYTKSQKLIIVQTRRCWLQCGFFRIYAPSGKLN